MGYTWYEWCSIFLIYAILGWCAEVCYATVHTGKFVNRGFLNGPVCPIYGCGGTVVVACLYPFRERFVLVFFGAIILSSVIEYITGYVLEKIFHEHWWDYSERPFNIKGYVCLEFSILWGIVCLLVVDILHPPIEKFVMWIPYRIEIGVLGLSFLVFLADMYVTVSNIVKWKKQMRLMNEIVDIIRGFSDGVGDSMSSIVLKAMDKKTEWTDIFTQDERYLEFKEELEKRKQETERLKEKYNRLIKQKSMGYKRLEKAFPRLSGVSPVRMKEMWQEIKEKGKQYGKKEK